MEYEDLLAMKLHDIHKTANDKLLIVRVIDGWIYNQSFPLKNGEFITSTFVREKNKNPKRVSIGGKVFTK